VAARAWRAFSGSISQASSRGGCGGRFYLSKLPGLDKKIRVAFDWTLDLLFPKDVCAVYDLDHDGRNFRWPGQGKNTTRNEDDYQSARSLRVDRSISGAFQKDSPAAQQLVEALRQP